MARPRIRSIKPEFWSDVKIARMSDSCALFYIALWNFCDDEGKIRNDPEEISINMNRRWHKGKVKIFINFLATSGQLRINSDATWLQVVKWSHQKIDKPKQPEVLSKELQWVADPISTTHRRHVDDTSALGSGSGSGSISLAQTDVRAKENEAVKGDSDLKPDFDFEAGYKKYPRRIGRKKGLEKFKKTVKTSEQYEDWLRAIDNYAAFCTREKRDKKYILYFSSFMTDWKDWVHPDSHEPEESERKIIPFDFGLDEEIARLQKTPVAPDAG